MVVDGVAMWFAVAMFVSSYLRHAFTTEPGHKQPITSPERNSVVARGALSIPAMPWMWSGL